MLELNKVYNLDIFKGMSEMQDGSVDAIITDPPYFIENLKEDFTEDTIRRSSKNNIFHEDWDSSFHDLKGFKEFINKMLLEFRRILRDKGQVYMFCSYHHVDWIIQNIKDLDFRYYKPLIWYKPDTMGVFPNQYGCNYEVILWFRKKGDTGEVIFNIGNSQRDVFKFTSTNQAYRKECGYHPTCKPIQLIRQFIKNCTNPQDVVFDGFMGSGTTAVAAKQLHRQFIGFELEYKYYVTIQERLSQKTIMSNNITQFIKGGETWQLQKKSKRRLQMEKNTHSPISIKEQVSSLSQYAPSLTPASKKELSSTEQEKENTE